MSEPPVSLAIEVTDKALLTARLALLELAFGDVYALAQRESEDAA